MRKLLFLVAGLLITVAANAQTQRPKLVVDLVVDQVRWDYLYYYNNEYGSDGLKRSPNQGFSFENTHINYASTATAIGHNSVYTGSIPAFTDITDNSFYQDDESVYCCEDSTVKSVGSDNEEDQMSPHRTFASTIGDELQVATDLRLEVIGVALKDCASILSAGRAADAAYWWDTSVGRFVSSVFYMDKLPQWAEDFNAKNHTSPDFDIKDSPQGVTITFKMAEAALRNGKPGKGKRTDILTVSISSTDIIGHRFSTRGRGNHEAYIQLDEDLAWFLKVLNKEMGGGNYLLFLTAGHGATHNYNYMREHRIPAGGWDYKQTVRDLNIYLQGKSDISSVMGEDNYQFYLNDSTIETTGKGEQGIIDESIERLKKDPRFPHIFGEEKISETTMPNWIEERTQNGYLHGRSDRISVVTRPQLFGSKSRPDFRGTQHGQPFLYDIHIPFLLFGQDVKHGANNIGARIAGIAPTVRAILHIQTPNGYIGKARNQF